MCVARILIRALHYTHGGSSSTTLLNFKSPKLRRFRGQKVGTGTFFKYKKKHGTIYCKVVVPTILSNFKSLNYVVFGVKKLEQALF